jgi:hypothetical protein
MTPRFKIIVFITSYLFGIFVSYLIFWFFTESSDLVEWNIFIKILFVFFGLRFGSLISKYIVS